MFTEGSRSSTGPLVTDGCRSRTLCERYDGDDFRIGASLYTGGLFLDDVSDDTFTITPVLPLPPFFTVTSPNGGEGWRTRDLESISWVSDAMWNANVTLRLVSTTAAETFTNSMNVSSVVVRDSPVDWRVCPVLGDDDVVYRVQACVRQTGCPDVCDVSDGTFRILLPPRARSLTLTAPAHEGLLILGQTYDITSECQNADSRSVGTILGYVTSSVGDPFAVVPAETGCYSWTVPDTVREPRGYSIILRIGDEDCPEALARADFLTVLNLECRCGDVNADGGMDLHDVVSFADCVGRGPGFSAECACSDLNGSQRIDLHDYGQLQALFPEGSEAGPPKCP